MSEEESMMSADEKRLYRLCLSIGMERPQEGDDFSLGTMVEAVETHIADQKKRSAQVWDALCEAGLATGTALIPERWFDVPKHVTALKDRAERAEGERADAKAIWAECERKRAAAVEERDAARKDARVNQEKFEVAHKALETAADGEARCRKALRTLVEAKDLSERIDRLPILEQAAVRDQFFAITERAWATAREIVAAFPEEGRARG